MKHPEGLPPALAGLDRTLVMGILNVTPDSFSDGGLYLDHDAAVAHGLEMVEAGADLVDVGGESTRPGADPVDVAEESRRVVDVVRDLVAEGVHVSIDTRHASVARACVDAGSVLVNDVSAGRGDERMWGYVAGSPVPYVLMHNRGDGRSRDDLATYGDVVAEVTAELRARVDAAERDGIPLDRLVVDPGIGFAKRAGHNWSLVQESAMRALAAPASEGGLGLPLLVGASRKRFLGAHADGSTRPDDTMGRRDELTLEITRRAVRAGVWCVRVHDVAPNVQAVHDATIRAGARGPAALEEGS